jgi:cell fate (sporulation/competence/biofilm development) regulator YlbF (YheA/YmcA/DUF963 family)
MDTILSSSMHEATDALIGNLLASETFVRYQQAHARLNEDHQARILLEQLSQAQADLRKKQANSGVTQAEIDALRTLQEQVQHNKVIMIYAQTQQEAVNLLREINNEISQLLGINFASFANHATC